MPPREWAEAKTQFAIMFGERFVDLMKTPRTRFLTLPKLLCFESRRLWETLAWILSLDHSSA